MKLSGSVRGRPDTQSVIDGRRNELSPALTLVLAAAVALPNQDAGKPAVPEPRAKASDFTLKDLHRRPRSLDGYKDKKAFVIAFVGTECPLANLYVPTLIELHKEYEGKGVQFLVINSNDQDTFVAVSAHAQE